MIQAPMLRINLSNTTTACALRQTVRLTERTSICKARRENTRSKSFSQKKPITRTRSTFLNPAETSGRLSLMKTPIKPAWVRRRALTGKLPSARRSFRARLHSSGVNPWDGAIREPRRHPAILRDVLGLEVVQLWPSSIYVKHRESPWYIVNLPFRPDPILPTRAQRFVLTVESASQVEEAHQSFSRPGQRLGVTAVDPILTSNGNASFVFSDLNRNWWEVTNSD